ncbi:MAG TPA: hypothetical protein VEV16_09820 [Daejeonella sp.]|nr:hypothetical protein [Daejeonella sp.]
MNTLVKKTTSLRLNLELYQLIEQLAKRENRSVNNYIETLLVKATNFDTPNAETRQAIEDLNAEKKSLKRYSSAKELLNDLD